MILDQRESVLRFLRSQHWPLFYDDFFISLSRSSCSSFFSVHERGFQWIPKLPARLYRLTSYLLSLSLFLSAVAFFFLYRFLSCFRARTRDTRRRFAPAFGSAKQRRRLHIVVLQSRLRGTYFRPYGRARRAEYQRFAVAFTS